MKGEFGIVSPPWRGVRRRPSGPSATYSGPAPSPSTANDSAAGACDWDPPRPLSLPLLLRRLSLFLSLLSLFSSPSAAAPPRAPLALFVLGCSGSGGGGCGGPRGVARLSARPLFLRPEEDRFAMAERGMGGTTAEEDPPPLWLAA